MRQNELKTCAKEPYKRAKEPYKCTKETYTHKREPLQMGKRALYVYQTAL